MTNKRPFTSTIIVFIVLAAAVCVWLLFAAPVFQEKEKQVRTENAALTKDIAEIESMNGNLEELEGKFSEIERNIEEKLSSRADTAQKAAALIENICAGLGLYPMKIAVGQETLLHPAGALMPALYSVDITFLIESLEEAGADVIRGLESSRTADFEVTGFVYRGFPPEDDEGGYSGEWIIMATLYYYE